MTNTPVADLVAVDVPFSSTVGKSIMLTEPTGAAVAQLAIMVPSTRYEYRETAEGIAARILAALTPASAEPVAWRYDGLKIDNFDRPMFFTKRRSGTYLDPEEFSEIPLYAHPAPVTVEAAAQALLDNVTREGSMGLVYAAFDDAGCEWDEADEALRALSGEKS